MDDLHGLSRNLERIVIVLGRSGPAQGQMRRTADARHGDGGVIAQTPPETLLWLWRGDSR
ncbi:hypothetical protein ACSRUE_36970 [Sorangium sp. KYC3313]|uniref:hypothetical protein n=1 Tax=Sorangium sp. KYC3313 TaxID=3449740 RepID=UPI003F8A6757